MTMPQEPTYRQLDTWVRQGYLHPHNNGQGTGNHRYWPPAERRVADLMARLKNAGLDVPTAHRVARGDRELAPGITITIDGESP